MDDMYLYPMGRYGRMKMSHMIADTHAELLTMAAKIGVSSNWIQQVGTVDEHFDVCMSARVKAIEAGAKAIPLKDLAFMVKARRGKT